jgi:predicted dehydrogenase
LKELAAWKPDAVLVLTAETIRDDVGTELIELGVPRLFFEKPLVAREGQAHVSEDDFERGRKMINLARKRGCQTAMIFNYRFFDHTLLLKKLTAERDLGRILSVYCSTHYACWSHCIDLMLHLAGDIVEISAASGLERRTFYDAVDVSAAFRLAGGGAGTILGSSGGSLTHPLYEMTFQFERGRVRIEEIDGALELLAGEDGFAERIAPPTLSSRSARYDRSFARSLAAYLESLRSGSEPPVPGIAGLQELQFEAALRRSIAEGRTVKVQEEFPL